MIRLDNCRVLTVRYLDHVGTFAIPDTYTVDQVCTGAYDSFTTRGRQPKQRFTLVTVDNHQIAPTTTVRALQAGGSYRVIELPTEDA